MTQSETPAPAAKIRNPLRSIKIGLMVFGGLILIVGGIWGMSHLYGVMAEAERQAKIAEIIPIELNQIRKDAATELAGKNPDRGTMTIEAAMKAIAK